MVKVHRSQGESAFEDKEQIITKRHSKRKPADKSGIPKKNESYKLRFLASIIQSSEDAVIGENLDGNIISWNPAAERMFGYVAEEAIGQPMTIIGTGDRVQEFKKIIEDIKKGKNIERFETKRKTKDGKIVDVSVTISPIVNDEGDIIGISAIDRDITGQKKAAGYARSLIEASLDPLVTISPDGKITDVNEATIKVTGVMREDLIGTDFSNYFTEPEKARQGYQQVLRAGLVRDYPLTIKSTEGRLTDVLYNATVYKDEKGNVLGVFAAARDITAQKQASQYARSLIEASLDPLVTISPDGKITDVNEATVKVTGVVRDSLIGTEFSIYFTEPEKASEGYQRAYKEGFVTDYPLTIKHKDGKKLTDVLYNASIYKDEKGNVLGLFAAARDITAQKQASQYARSLIEASLDPLVTISPDGKITDVNEATVKITGVLRDKLIGTDFSNYFTEPEKAREGYQKVLKEGFVTDYALTIRHVDSTLSDVLYNASVYKDEKGNVLGVFAAARDVTKTKQASQYARSLIEASLDPLVTISPDGKITDVNDATVKVTGVVRDELIGTDFSNYFTEPEKAREGYQRVYKEGNVKDYPLTIKRNDSIETDVLYNASVYKDEKGNVLGVFAAARDVTKTKQASQYARSLIEASLDPLVTIGPDGKITDVNEATIKVTSVTREELVGSDFSIYFTEPEKAREGYQRVYKEGQVTDYALTIKGKDGKLTDVLYNASVYKDEKGNVIGVFAAARDVTDTKKASQYSRSLIEASLDPLVTISAEGKITDVNDATVEITGVPRDELIGTDFSNYFTEPDKAREGYQRVFKEGSVTDYALTIRSRTGKETPVFYNASVYRDERGKVLGVFAAARDITAQKKAYEQLEVAAKTLAGGATQQSRQSDEISKSVTQMAAAFQQMAASAREASTIATETSKLGQETGSSSEKIGEIVDTITNIAGQTNLLALNAAIEAARAGESGRGFAVVADEVRKLAESSRTSAGEIRDMIKTVSEQVTNTVSAIQKVSAKIQEVSSGVEQQSSSVQQISGTMDAIAGIAEKNAQKAEELLVSTAGKAGNIPQRDKIDGTQNVENYEGYSSTSRRKSRSEEISKRLDAVKTTAKGIIE
jgi:PAS domain S-box-containing protein